MVHLIIVVIAILLGSIAVVSTFSYIPVDSEVRITIKERTEKGIDALSEGLADYMLDQRNASGDIELTVPRSDLIDVLDVDYVFVPPGIADGDWSAGTGYYDSREAAWICLAPPTDGWPESARQGIGDAADTLAPSAVVFADSCGEESDTGGDYLTYWRLPDRLEARSPEVTTVTPPSDQEEVDLSQEHVSTVRYRAEATLPSAVQSEDNPAARVIVETQKPGESSWTERDRWEVDLAAIVDEVNQSGGGTTQPTGDVDLNTSGSVMVSTMPGELHRLTIEADGNASVDVTTGEVRYE